MWEIRSSGSLEGVMNNRDPYSNSLNRKLSACAIPLTNVSMAHRTRTSAFHRQETSTVGSRGEISSQGFTRAPGGALTGPCNNGSLVAIIQTSKRFRICWRVALCKGFVARLLRSFGSNIKSYSSSEGTFCLAHPFSTQRVLLGPSSQFGRTGWV